MTRPRGRPPTPSARSSPSEPVEMISDVADERVRAELHDGALAELLFDLADGEIERAFAIVRIARAIAIHFCCHGGHTPPFHLELAVVSLSDRFTVASSTDVRRLSPSYPGRTPKSDAANIRLATVVGLGNLCTGRFRARSASRPERKARSPTAYLNDTPRASRRRRSGMDRRFVAGGHLCRGSLARSVRTGRRLGE